MCGSQMLYWVAPSSRTLLEAATVPFTSYCKERDGLEGTEWALRGCVKPGSVPRMCW